MATPKSLEALEKTKEALGSIKSNLLPVLERLQDNGFAERKSQAQATVALSVGMMKYMGARLRGLDQGRKKDDPLRHQLDHMRKVLATIKKRHAKKREQQATETRTSTADETNTKRPKTSCITESSVDTAVTAAAVAPTTRKDAKDSDPTDTPSSTTGKTARATRTSSRKRKSTDKGSSGKGSPKKARS